MLMDAFTEIKSTAIGTRTSEGVKYGGGTSLTYKVEVTVPLKGQFHAALLPNLVAYIAVAAWLVEFGATVDGVYLSLTEVQLG